MGQGRLGFSSPLKSAANISRNRSSVVSARWAAEVRVQEAKRGDVAQIGSPALLVDWYGGDKRACENQELRKRVRERGLGRPIVDHVDDG